jgi:hypothetical protein
MLILVTLNQTCLLFSYIFKYTFEVVYLEIYDAHVLNLLTLVTQNSDQIQTPISGESGHMHGFGKTCTVNMSF